MKRLQFVITGQVQGVGFRPHVYRVARALDLTGWIQNHALGVMIEVQGVGTAGFIAQLRATLPPLAKIDSILTYDCITDLNESAFEIRASEPGSSQTMIAADTAICEDCLHELFDPVSRYFQYPFLNCTQCGPRFTMTRALPYDRAQTAMDCFPLCVACEKEYSDPANRRYHAQPTACAQCGPVLSMPIDAIAKALHAGKIIAIKAMGGYQLCCDARQDEAVAMLRRRKQRDAKPFAIMVFNVESARQFVDVDRQSETYLRDPARPIVLLKKNRSSLSQLLAPGLNELGIMLPAIPFHYLLFHALAGWDEMNETHACALVMTSANVSGEPLITEDELARKMLAPIADHIVSYNRAIVTRADDSVLRPMKHGATLIRRARGFCPERIQLPHSIPCTLGLGGDLKNTFCITRGDEAFVSQHIGSLNNMATIEFFHESLDHWIRFLGVEIERIACDWHPDFYTTRLASMYTQPAIGVQHHHAHLAAVIAEHHLREPVLGLALDGYGLGKNGESWGGELCFLEDMRCQRLSSLLPLTQPGGDRAAREPWRMAASVLHALGETDEIHVRFADQPYAPLLAEMLRADKGLWTRTSSAGRLFDAASALLGVTAVSTYESQAAMQLESLVTQPFMLPNSWIMNEQGLSFLPLLEQLIDRDPIEGANGFHGSFIAGLAAWIMEYAQITGLKTIVVSGGCFLNRVLTDGLIDLLKQAEFSVCFPMKLPPNDGGISLGQAWIAGNEERR